MKEKKFLDTVHGYIYVPEQYCNKLIDTINFQRLRRIEQTSSRSLYPCARHDRFIHSIGTYHIGRKIINSIKNRINIENSIENSYLIACLLHDCGHSPFSHTFENLFGDITELFKIYKECIKSKGLDENIDIINIDIDKTDVKHHEIISAILCIAIYYENIIELGGNPALVARMIMGIGYDLADTKYTDVEQSLKNCFISLLHGDVIDADKIDYICRDKWASGYISLSVDVERLISSIILYKDKGTGLYNIGYEKSAVNEIKSLIESKNFQHNKIYKHHQVIYEQKLLKDSVKALTDKLAIAPNLIFNYKALLEPQRINNDNIIYMPTDDDIISLLKSNLHDNLSFQEWFSRSYNYVPLWKSISEMQSLLSIESDSLFTKLLKDGAYYDIICKKFFELANIKSFALDATPTNKKVFDNQVKIVFPSGKSIDFNKLYNYKNNSCDDITFKYIFIDKKFSQNKDKCIQIIVDVLNRKETNGQQS